MFSYEEEKNMGCGSGNSSTTSHKTRKASFRLQTHGLSCVKCNSWNDTTYLLQRTTCIYLRVIPYLGPGSGRYLGRDRFQGPRLLRLQLLGHLPYFEPLLVPEGISTSQRDQETIPWQFCRKPQLLYLWGIFGPSFPFPTLEAPGCLGFNRMSVKQDAQRAVSESWQQCQWKVGCWWFNAQDTTQRHSETESLQCGTRSPPGCVCATAPVKCCDVHI